jgi:competence protein ComEC
MAGLIAYIEQVGYALARVPVAAITVPKFPTWLGVAYYSALGPAIAGANATGHRRKVSFMAAAIAPAAISFAALAAWAGASPEAVVMNVGDGQAVLLRGPGGAIVIDGGPSPVRLRDELGTQLPPWQHRLDAIVITAPGLGHIGGFAGFDRPAATVVLPAVAQTGSAWRTAAFEQVARGASISKMAAGASARLAGFELQVLAPERGAPGDEVGAAYMGLRVVAGDGRSFCDLSDLDLDAQTVAASRLRGACTYLLLPRGGRSRLSPDLEHRAITASTQLIASRSSGRLAAGFPPNVLRTDQEGTITLPL